MCVVPATLGRESASKSGVVPVATVGAVVGKPLGITCCVGITLVVF
jgi:hypothetical protein